MTVKAIRESICYHTAGSGPYVYLLGVTDSGGRGEWVDRDDGYRVHRIDGAGPYDRHVDVVFRHSRGSERLQFVEVEDHERRSIGFGEWNGGDLVIPLGR